MTMARRRSKGDPNLHMLREMSANVSILMNRYVATFSPLDLPVEEISESVFTPEEARASKMLDRVFGESLLNRTETMHFNCAPEYYTVTLVDQRVHITGFSMPMARKVWPLTGGSSISNMSRTVFTRLSPEYRRLCLIWAAKRARAMRVRDKVVQKFDVMIEHNPTPAQALKVWPALRAVPKYGSLARRFTASERSTARLPEFAIDRNDPTQRIAGWRPADLEWHNTVLAQAILLPDETTYYGGITAQVVREPS